MDDLISKKEAVNAICESGTKRERYGDYITTLSEAKQWAVDILESLPSAIQWIPAENPPEAPHEKWACDMSGSWHESDVVIAKTKNGDIMSAIYIPDDANGEFWIASATSDTIDDVIEWMPMLE